MFGQVFTEFAGRMAATYRMQQGQARIKAHAAAFARAEKEYGVPPAVIAAFWGLESDFGANMGNLPTLRSLVSLAYDCRRSDRFVGETIAALKIIDRGDLTPAEMVGSWAGELGQTQFLPTHYFTYAVDYDGDGRRDLLRSPADVIGSTANYIATGLKWRRGEPWLQEVRVPRSQTSHLVFPGTRPTSPIQLPRSKWAQLGVTYADGKALPNDDLPASLLLPMGRTGPAFLAYANFAAYTEWNNSLIYSTTAGYLATRIAGAAADASPDGGRRAAALQRAARTAATAGARGLQCRQGRRRDGPAEPQRGEGDADQIRPAGGFLADRRIAGAHARAPRAGDAGRCHGCAIIAVPTSSASVAQLCYPVIPGWSEGPDPESSSSGFATRSRPGMTTITNQPKEHPMSFYDATVPAFLQILGSLTGLLTKAEAHCKAKNIAPEVLLSARLYPDMLPFSRQIQLACDFAAKELRAAHAQRGAVHARHRKELR